MSIFSTFVQVSHQSTRLRGWLAGVAVISLLALLPGRATADEFDPSYSTFSLATITSGATLSVDSNGNYTFGFASANTPILIKVGSTSYTVTGIESVYLVHDGPSDGKNSIAATLSANGAPITEYNGDSSSPNWTGGLAQGAKFPSYSAGDFGSSNFLREGSGSAPQSGVFSFTNITINQDKTDPFYFGAHLRWLDPSQPGGTNTGFMMFAPPTAPPPTPTPEPSALILCAGFGLGLGFWGVWTRRRQRLAVEA